NPVEFIPCGHECLRCALVDEGERAVGGALRRTAVMLGGRCEGGGERAGEGSHTVGSNAPLPPHNPLAGPIFRVALSPGDVPGGRFRPPFPLIASAGRSC